VRAWLLRKNYTNLRASVRSLQQAWRERRRTTTATAASTTSSTTLSANKINTSSSTAASAAVGTTIGSVDRSSSTIPSGGYGSVMDVDAGAFSSMTVASMEYMNAPLSGSNLAPIREEVDAECISVGSYDLDAFPLDDNMSRGSNSNNNSSSMSPLSHLGGAFQHSAPTSTSSSSNTNTTSSLFKIQPSSLHLSSGNAIENLACESMSPVQLPHSSTTVQANNKNESASSLNPVTTTINSSTTREVFSNLRRQAIASMVIQRNLVRFWRDKNNKNM